MKRIPFIVGAERAGACGANGGLLVTKVPSL